MIPNVSLWTAAWIAGPGFLGAFWLTPWTWWLPS